MIAPPLCPACRQPVSPGDAVCFHCRAVLDPFTSGARVADRYVIEQSIGQGGMGRVYRAYDEALHEKVAIKTLLPEFATNPGFLTRFRDEVRLARRVAHPNVCRVHDYVDHEGTPFLSMEWVEGETLATRLKRLGPRPEAELRIVRSDVGEALRALWSNGIVHRDLKPANLMWTRAGRVKVMDFGLARALRGEGERDRTSGVVGSPEYLSPEQIRGESATEKSDTYALGVTLFELATGHPPFRGDSPAQTVMKHLSEMPDASALVAVSEDMRSTILQSLQKAPAARPDLRMPESGERGVDLKPTRIVGVRASRTMAWAASLAAVGSLIAVAVYLGSGSPSRPNVSPSPAPSASALSPPLVSPTVRAAPPPDAATTSTPGRVPSALPSVAPTPRSALVTPSEVPAPPTPAPTPTAPALAPQTPTPVAVTTPAPTPALSPTLPAEARLVVVVVPWADVFVDGELKGQTPLPSALVLRPGSHVVELRNKYFRPFLRTIELKAGEQILMKVDLQIEAVRR